jgi:hypothetical protein
MKKGIVYFQKASATVVGGLLLVGNASAVGVDLSTLTGAVDVSTVSTAILAVAAILMGPRIVKYAVTTVMKFFPK